MAKLLSTFQAINNLPVSATVKIILHAHRFRLLFFNWTFITDVFVFIAISCVIASLFRFRTASNFYLTFNKC